MLCTSARSCSICGKQSDGKAMGGGERADLGAKTRTPPPQVKDTVAGKRVSHGSAEDRNTLLADNELYGTYRRAALPGQSWRRSNGLGSIQRSERSGDQKRLRSESRDGDQTHICGEIHGLGRRAPCRVDICQGASPFYFAPVLFEVGEALLTQSVPVKNDCGYVRAPTGAACRATRGQREQGSSTETEHRVVSLQLMDLRVVC